ncbi:MAG TPA: EscU/YscU/HrcU family type III secretion system export apparatus switch protein [Nitrospirae bacterium]|nr:EscU/YscU/HrcU family type III secretion system export apparatus switch protein [Nitrospirota bacterium]
MKEERKKAAALRYTEGVDAAPRVVARGRGWLAEKMIALAREHGVPVHEDRALVEILSTLDTHEEIPPELYRAVAEVLAFIYRTNGRWR